MPTDTFIDYLNNTNMYDLSEGSMVLAELESYAVGLNVIANKLSCLHKELFVQTAGDAGLENHEKYLGLYTDETLSLENRRENILQQLKRKQGLWKEEYYLADARDFSYPQYMVHDYKMVAIEAQVELIADFMYSFYPVLKFVWANRPPSYSVKAMGQLWTWQQLHDYQLTAQFINTYPLPWGLFVM